MARNTTRRGQGGSIVQSGLDMSSTREGRAPMNGPRPPTRAVVLKTYAYDAQDKLIGGEQALATAGGPEVRRIECDVLIAKSQQIVYRVEVLQPSHGLANASLWIPKPTTRSLDPSRPLPAKYSPLSPSGTQQALLPRPSDLDGDNVLVTYLDGDFRYPIITGAFAHPQSRRRATAVSGGAWATGDAPSIASKKRGNPHVDESYVRFAGTEVRTNAAGDVLLDTVGATTDEVTEAPGTSGGQVRCRLKQGQKLVVEDGASGVSILEVYSDSSGNLHVDLGPNAAEKMVKGDTLVSWLLAHVHPTGVGPSGAAVNPAGGVDLNDALSTLHRISST